MGARGVALLSTLFLLAFAGQASASGVTNSGDDLRTGWYPGESLITPELLEGGTFGQEWSTKVEGQVYAQPLLYNGTLLVATERNSIYGLDPSTGAAKWSKTLPHGTPWNPADIGCADLTPSIGVTATPVIDSSTGTAYLTHKSYASGTSGPATWWMDAIEMSTGNEKAGFPVEMGGEAQNFPGLGFDAANELQRPGLLLLEGVVYAAFGSHCDHDPYQGWVFGVSTSGAVKARWAADGDGAGIWQSGAGLTSDGAGRILLSTGNGFDFAPPIPGSTPPEALGQSVVRLQVQSDGTLKAADFFAPYDANELNTWDADFGSGGVTGLPNAYFGTPETPHLAVAVGKDGYVYLLNRDNLGGYGTGPSGQDNVVARIGPNGGVWSRPGVWPGEGGWVYIPTASAGHSAGGSSGNLDIYHYALSPSGKPKLSLEGESPEAFGFSSGPPVITSNGIEKGSALVWDVWAPNGGGEGAELRAYAAQPVEKKAVLLWSKPVGKAAKFSTPGVGLGRLYVGTRDETVVAFGSPVTPPISGSRTEFPLTQVGKSSEERTLTLTANVGVTVEKIEVSQPEFTAKKPTPPLPATLGPGQQMTIPVIFSPTAAGPQAATLKVTINGGETLSFSLSGTGQAIGPKLEVSPSVLTFGGTTIGSTVVATALIKNVGSEKLVVTGHKGPGLPFQLEESLPKELAPEEAAVVPIDFSPTTNGSFASVVELETNGGNGAIHLTGVAAPPGLLAITPEHNDFGQVPVGGEAVRSFAITNTGGLPVKINISKPPVASEFRAITSLAEGESEIGPGETVTESVRFTPTVLGPAGDVWRITGQDATGLHEVSFVGEGTAPAGTPTMVSSTPGGGSLAFAAGIPRASLTSTRLLASHSGAISVRVRCGGGAGSCAGTITLRTAKPVRPSASSHRAVILTLASARFRIADGHAATVVLHLSGLARALLARDRTLHVRATTVTRDWTGATHTLGALATLRPAPAVKRP